MKTLPFLLGALLCSAPLFAQNPAEKKSVREIDARISAGKIQRERGQNQKAKSLFESALRLANAQIKAAPTSQNLEKRAQIFSLLGNEEKAGTDLTRAIELEIRAKRPAWKPSEEFAVGAPADPVKFNARLVKLYLSRAQNRQSRGEMELARADFEAVLRLDSQNEEAQKALQTLFPQPPAAL